MPEKQPSMDAVVYLSPPNPAFSDTYLGIRDKENRVLSDAEVERLPETLSQQPHHKEWRLRKKSADRFIAYLKDKKQPLHILDIGCGNGWMSRAMGKLEGVYVEAVDMNPVELEQAQRTKGDANVTYVHADIFQMAPHFMDRFDLVLLNASVQYFAELPALLRQLKEFLKANGAIHIMDSPFYNKSEVTAAKKRTEAYYTQMGFEHMAQWYYHHSWNNLPPHELLYDPKGRSALVKKWKPDSPFPWIRILAKDL